MWDYGRKIGAGGREKEKRAWRELVLKFHMTACGGTDSEWCWDVRARFEPYLGISAFQLHGLEQAFAILQLLQSSGCFPKDISLKRMHKQSL